MEHSKIVKMSTQIDINTKECKLLVFAIGALTNVFPDKTPDEIFVMLQEKLAE